MDTYRHPYLIHASNRLIHLEIHRDGPSDIGLHFWLGPYGVHLFTRKSIYAPRISFERHLSGYNLDMTAAPEVDPNPPAPAPPTPSEPAQPAPDNPQPQTPPPAPAPDMPQPGPAAPQTTPPAPSQPA
jgi:hypothetical protein